MVGRLAERVGAAEDLVRVERGGEDHVHEERAVHVMRAAEGGQCAAGLQELERTEMDLLVTAQRVFHGGTRAGEGRRIEDDHVILRQQLLVRTHGGLRFEPVEHVRFFEDAFVAHTVRLGIRRGGFDGVRALIQRVDVGGAFLRGVDGESAEEAEAIEDVRALGHLRHALVIRLLIQVEPRLVTAERVRLEGQAVQLHIDVAFHGTGDDAVRIRQALELAGGQLVAFHDGAGGEDALQRGDDLRLAHVHAEGGSLEHQHVLILVHDQAAEEIALRIHHAEGRGLGHVLLADGQRGPDAPLEEGEVHLLALMGDEAHVDLGLGIVKADAEEPLAMILHLHDVAGFGGLGEAQDGRGVNPRMPGQNAIRLTGPEQDDWQRIRRKGAGDGRGQGTGIHRIRWFRRHNNSSVQFCKQ